MRAASQFWSKVKIKPRCRSRARDRRTLNPQVCRLPTVLRVYSPTILFISSPELTMWGPSTSLLLDAVSLATRPSTQPSLEKGIVFTIGFWMFRILYNIYYSLFLGVPTVVFIVWSQVLHLIIPNRRLHVGAWARSKQWAMELWAHCM